MKEKEGTGFTGGEWKMTTMVKTLIFLFLFKRMQPPSVRRIRLKATAGAEVFAFLAIYIEISSTTCGCKKSFTQQQEKCVTIPL